MAAAAPRLAALVACCGLLALLTLYLLGAGVPRTRTQHTVSASAKGRAGGSLTAPAWLTHEPSAWSDGVAPLTHAPSAWRVWDFERPFGPPVPCRWSPLVPPPTPGLRRRPWNSSVCLRPAGDLLSDTLANDGHWAECDDLPLLYAIGLVHAGGGQAATAILDVGMNLGACTLHLLLATDAQVLSFEPGGGNLAHAMSSLLALASHHPGVRSRSHVFPIGLGETNTSFWLHPALGNAGHSVLGRSQEVEERLARFDPSDFGAAEAVLVRPGDDVLWPRRREGHGPAPRFAMMKLDVEGFECNALRGMRRLLAAGAVQTVKLEVFDVALRAQGCSGVGLQRLLSESGFRLYRTLQNLDEARCHWSAAGTRQPPQHKPLSPDRLYGQAELPYNIYAIHCPEGLRRTADARALSPRTIGVYNNGHRPGRHRSDWYRARGSALRRR